MIDYTKINRCLINIISINLQMNKNQLISLAIQVASHMGNQQAPPISSRYQSSSSSSSMLPEQQKMEEECVTFKIATFNYGYCDSPFQYYDQYDIDDLKSGLFQDFENLFLKIIKKSIDEQEAFIFQKLPNQSLDANDMNKVLERIRTYDKKYRVGRYSPLYYKEVGVLNYKFLQLKEQFMEDWERYLKQVLGQEIYFSVQIDRFALEILCKYDWACYFILILYVYLEDKSQIRNMDVKEAEKKFIEIVESQTSQKYRQFLQTELSKTVIDEKYKLKKLLVYLEESETDIIFLQNFDKQKLSQVTKSTDKYRIACEQGFESVILISWKWFANIWPDDTLKPLSYYNMIHFSMKELHEIKSILEYTKEEKFRKSITTQFFKTKNRELESPTKKKSPAKKKMNEIPDNPEDKGLFQLKKSEDPKPQYIPRGISESDSEDSDDSWDEEQEANNKNLTLSKKISKELNKTRKQKISKQVMEKLGSQQELFIQFFDRIILVSLELFVEAENREEQIFDILRSLKQQFPKYQIIMGVEACGKIDNDQNQNFHIFPGPHNKFNNPYKQQTFFKVQTIFQLLDKNFAVTKQPTDHQITSHLISTIPLFETKIIDIKGNQIEKNSPKIIPSEDHPYEHFLKISEVCYSRNSISSEELMRKKYFEMTYASMFMKKPEKLNQ